MEADLREANLRKSLKLAVDNAARKVQAKSLKLYRRRSKHNASNPKPEVALEILQECLEKCKDSMQNEFQVMLDEEEIPSAFKELMRVQTQFYQRYPERKGIDAWRPTNLPSIDGRSIRMKKKQSYLSKCQDDLNKIKQQLADATQALQQQRNDMNVYHELMHKAKPDAETMGTT